MVQPLRNLREFRKASNLARQQSAQTAILTSKMRANPRLSLSKVAKELGIDAKTAIRLAGRSLRKDKRGRWTATKTDTLLRVLTLPGPRGEREIPTKDSRTASQLGRYLNAVRRYVHNGDAEALKEFRRLKLVDASGRRISLVTNLRKLDELGHAGLLSFHIMYRGAS